MLLPARIGLGFKEFGLFPSQPVLELWPRSLGGNMNIFLAMNLMRKSVGKSCVMFLSNALPSVTGLPLCNSVCGQ